MAGTVHDPATLACPVVRSNRCGHVLALGGPDSKPQMSRVAAEARTRGVRGLEVVVLSGSDLDAAMTALLRSDRCVRCRVAPAGEPRG